MMCTRVFVTGASGFVGRQLVARLAEQKEYRVVAASRAERAFADASVGSFLVDRIDGSTQWLAGLEDVQVVIHLAARAHVMKEKSSDPLGEFRRVNVDGTLNLARAAAQSGVRRFVFISSIGVNGAKTFDRPFAAQDQVAPHSPYAISKYEAELGLQALASGTGMEVVIIRPPLVYGPDAPGNFGALLRWVRRGVPLPLGAVTHNRRSLVALDNLVDLIVTCLTHPAAANQTFLVSDGEDLSTADLLRRMGRALGKPARLLPVPPALLKLGAALLGKPELAQRLCGSLQVDIAKTRALLGWTPPLSVDEGLRRAAAGYGRGTSV